MLASYDVKKLLIKFSIPAIAGMAVNALYNFVDAFFVSKGAGEMAIGGLTIAFPIQMIVMAVGLMIGMGSASIFSRAYGEKNHEKMAKSVNTAIWLDMMLALLFTVLGFLFIDPLLVFFGGTSANIGYAKDYMSIILIGLVPLSLSMVLNNLTRAEGRANIAMISMMIGTGLNIILDPIFIFDFRFGLGLGVKGAAIATIISQIAAFFYILIQSQKKQSALHISYREGLQFDPKMATEIISVGMPSFLRNSIGAFLAIIIIHQINRYAVGDPGIYVSIYGVINRVITFVFMPSFGLVQGLAPIVGFSYGAKNYHRLKSVVAYTMKLILVYFIFGFAFVEIFSGAIFRLFSSTGDPTFILMGAKAFRFVALGFMVVGFQILISSVYQSEGYPIRATFVALSRQVIFFIPLVYLLTRLMGIEGIWISFAISDILSGLISMFLYFVEMRRIHHLINTNSLQVS